LLLFRRHSPQPFFQNSFQSLVEFLSTTILQTFCMVFFWIMSRLPFKTEGFPVPLLVSPTTSPPPLLIPIFVSLSNCVFVFWQQTFRRRQRFLVGFLHSFLRFGPPSLEGCFDIFYHNARRYCGRGNIRRSPPSLLAFRVLFNQSFSLAASGADGFPKPFFFSPLRSACSVNGLGSERLALLVQNPLVPTKLS